MGRTKLIEKLSNEIKIENSREKNWLVSYGFINNKPNPHFFNKLQELTRKLLKEGANADKSLTSIFISDDLYGALIAAKLAKHYGAHVRLFKVDKMVPNLSIYPEYEFTIEEHEVYSVRKAVYCELKKRYMNYSPSNETDQLGIFLWATETHTIPTVPLKKEDLALIIDKCRYLEDQVKTNSRNPPPFGLEYYNAGPIMKAIETYLVEYKNDSTEDIEILFNVLRRITDDEDEPYEPSLIDIDLLLHKRPADNLIKSIKKSKIAHEIL
jgi:hypothetical protein